MKQRLLPLVLVVILTLTSLHAEARRLGGGKSFGRQSSNVTQREQARTPPATPPQQQAAGAAATAPATAAAGAPAKRPWGAMLGGLATGLGLAWLASQLGLGEGLGSLMLVLLLIVVGGLLIRRLVLNRPGAGAGLVMQGAGYAPANPAPLPHYNPEKVGNDASARPWENSYAAPGSMIGSALLGGSQNWGVPAGFDIEGFVAAAKRNFITLQDAWDRADIATLRAMMTDDMVLEIRNQLAEREETANGQTNKTEIIHLDAQLLGLEELDDNWMASVEFNAMVREAPSAAPEPMREVWNMTKQKSGGGWLVAGVQAFQ